MTFGEGEMKGFKTETGQFACKNIHTFSFLIVLMCGNVGAFNCPSNFFLSHNRFSVTS